MAISFEKRAPDWGNVGAEPDDGLKKDGFKAGYRPPAAYFNWFFNRISECVKELQTELPSSLKSLAFKDEVDNDDITNVAADKVTQDREHQFVSDEEKRNWNRPNKTILLALPASGWSAAAPFTQTVSVTGVTAVDAPVIGISIADGAAAATVKAQNKAWGCVDRAVTGNGTITFYCYNKKPAADFTVNVKGVG